MKIKSITEQIKILSQLFPNLQLSLDNTAKLEVSEDMEGLFLIPHFMQFGSYNEAVAKVLAKLKETRKCYDWRNGNWGEKYLKQTEKKEQWWKTQTDVVVLPCQTGKKFKGISVEDARKSGDFLLGIYEVGIMLLTHPERLQSSNDLWIDCGGDEYSFSADGRFEDAPFFNFRGGELKFRASWFARALGCFGAASAFIPQSLGSESLEASDTRPLNTRSLLPAPYCYCPHCGVNLK